MNDDIITHDEVVSQAIVTVLSRLNIPTPQADIGRG
jgi:hypothetical protein